MCAWPQGQKRMSDPQKLETEGFEALVGAGTPPTHKVSVPMLSVLRRLPIPSFSLEMGSHVAQAGLQLTAQLRMMLIFGSSCSASAVLRITDSHHAQTLQGKEQNLGYMHAGKHHYPSHIPGHLYGKHLILR